MWDEDCVQNQRVDEGWYDDRDEKYFKIVSLGVRQKGWFVVRHLVRVIRWVVVKKKVFNWAWIVKISLDMDHFVDSLLFCVVVFFALSDISD